MRGIRNRGIIGLQIEADLRIKTDYQGKKITKRRKGLQNGAKGFHIGVEVTNWGRDYKSVQPQGRSGLGHIKMVFVAKIFKFAYRVQLFKIFVICCVKKCELRPNLHQLILH